MIFLVFIFLLFILICILLINSVENADKKIIDDSKNKKELEGPELINSLMKDFNKEREKLAKEEKPGSFEF